MEINRPLKTKCSKIEIYKKTARESPSRFCVDFIDISTFIS